MPWVINATNEEVNVKVAGNWFKFTKGQKKMMNESIAKFILLDRRESGLAVLSPEFDENFDEHAKTPEGEAALAEQKKNALNQYLAFHRERIHNNQVSLRQDLDKANIKVDPAVYASSGEIEAMKIVAAYQAAETDAEANKIKEVKELLAKGKKQ